MDFRVNLIIVTYGNRFDFVNSIVKWALPQNIIDKIYIADNHSVPDSSKKLNDLRKTDSRIVLKTYERNMGPGTAICEAMEFFKKHSPDSFCWILDDDNLPEKDALANLFLFLEKNGLISKRDRTILASYRVDRRNYFRAVNENRPDLIIGSVDMFRTFHLLKLLKRSESSSGNNSTEDSLPAAPYGGMFFHLSLTDNIGFPDKDFVIYFDDHEYSRRLILKGGSIFLVRNSIVNDMENSWYHKKSFGFMNLACSRKQALLYYSVRNRIFFEKKYLVQNRFIYFINGAIYTGMMIASMTFTLNFKNLKVFIEAVFDGCKNNKHSNFHLD